MKQTRCIALLVGITMIGSLLLPIGNVKAATTQSIQIENRGTMSFFRYEGNLVNQRYLMHGQDGNFHPVYRISAQSENSPEDIQAEVGNSVIDKKIYQIIKAGYPYKTASQLGCSSDFYAYIATQTAIDCYIRGYDLEKLETVSSDAKIMKQAISLIYENSANEVQSSKLSIQVSPTKEWEMIDKQEMQREYEVSCNYGEFEYVVSTTQDSVQIRNTQNECKSVFSDNERMRLAISKENLAQDIMWNTTLRVEKSIKDMYQTERTSNGKVYVLCGYQFTQEAETTFEEIVSAYQEEPEENPEEQDTNENVGNTEEPKQDANESTQNTTEKEANDAKDTITKTTKDKEANSKTVLPKTGF